MAINTLTYNENLTGELDRVLVQRSVTGFMADNVLRAKFVGAKTVLIPDVEMQGLGDYNRDTGFVRGTVTVANTPFTLQQDRGRSFTIDAEDADETGVSDLIGKVSAEFVRTKVIPEMDAYVLSKLGGLAAEQGNLIEGDPATDAYAMLLSGIHKAQAAVGYDEELVAFANSTFWEALQKTPELSRTLVMNDFARGDLNVKVATVNGVSILPVQEGRMMSAYTFGDGATAGQEEGGFAPADEAKHIGLIVMPKKACSLVKKTEKTRIFDPKENLAADAWKLDYRVYYDAFVKKSYTDAIFSYTY
ncbi:MAG: hypothetical protein E7541_00965 [Ruminococcaceae bacterium]|nr:hypothetical protein [Oscillospiraceae bacterium]